MKIPGSKVEAYMVKQDQVSIEGAMHAQLGWEVKYGPKMFGWGNPYMGETCIPKNLLGTLASLQMH